MPFILQEGFTIENLVTQLRDPSTLGQARHLLEPQVALLKGKEPARYQDVVVLAADVMLGSVTTSRDSLRTLMFWVFKPLPRNSVQCRARLSVLATAFSVLAVRKPFPEMTDNVIMSIVAQARRQGGNLPAASTVAGLKLSDVLLSQAQEYGLESIGC